MYVCLFGFLHAERLQSEHVGWIDGSKEGAVKWQIKVYFTK